MQAVTFSTEIEGPDRVKTARVGHLYECADGSRLRVLAIGSDDPVCVTLETGRQFSIACGSIVSTEAEPRAPRTTKGAPREEPPLVVSPASDEAVRAITYHTPLGAKVLKLNDLFERVYRVQQIVRGDPVYIVLLDAKGVITSRELCGAGSVATWRYA